MSDHPEQSIKPIPRGVIVPAAKRKKPNRFSTFKPFGGKGRYVGPKKVRRNLICDPRNWEWAMQQPGKASRFINTLLDMHRKQDERKHQAAMIVRLRNEVLRLEKKLRDHNIEPLDEVPNGNEKS